MFDWQDYLILAKALAAGSDPSYHRSAVSRAYYFAYNIAEDLAQKKHFSPPHHMHLHEGLWEAFRTVSPEVSSVGNQMRRARTYADYEAAALISRNDADLAIIRAEKLARLFQGI